MAQFLTRVELYGVNHDHQVYTILHSLMEQAGFTRYIFTGDGKRYHLPTAEYLFNANSTPDAVRDLAGACAAKAWPQGSHGVLVGESYPLVWRGLKPA